MPDILGRYTLAEMRERTRRILDALQAVVDPVTGAEQPGALVTPIYSNEDLNFFINSAITSVWTDVVLSCDTVFADSELIDVKKDKPDYELPDDMAQLRGVFWKDPSVSLLVVPPSRRTPMHQIDEFTANLDIFLDGSIPTYRREVHSIVLNQTPTKDNPGGILIRYIKHANFLDNDGITLETEWARVMQEVVIREAAVEANEERGQLDSTTLKARLDEWKTRFSLVVRNSNNPPFINMVIPQHPLRKASQR